MKVGDKVYIETEVIKVNDVLVNTKLGCFDKLEVIPQLPIQEGRWMMVSHSGDGYVSRFVIGKFKGNFIAIQNASTEVDLKKSTDLTTPWKYAKEIPVKRIITLAEVAKLTGESIDEIEFEK